jgi:hypothetical protein
MENYLGHPWPYIGGSCAIAPIAAQPSAAACEKLFAPWKATSAIHGLTVEKAVRSIHDRCFEFSNYPAVIPGAAQASLRGNPESILMRVAENGFPVPPATSAGGPGMTTAKIDRACHE